MSDREIARSNRELEQRLNDVFEDLAGAREEVEASLRRKRNEAPESGSANTDQT